MDDFTEDSAANHLRKRVSLSLRVSAILRIYGVFGVLISVGAIGYLAYSRLNLRLTDSEQIALVLAIAGALIAVLSFAGLVLRRSALEREDRMQRQYAALSKFIEAWKSFEESSRRAAFGHGDDSPRSIRDTLSKLRSDGTFSPSDIFEIEELLRLRNALVHGSQHQSPELISEALERLIGFITKVA